MRYCPPFLTPSKQWLKVRHLFTRIIPKNINVEIHQSFGNVEEAFSRSFHVRKDTFVGHRTHHAPMEPHVSIAMWDGEKVTLYTSTQKPHYLQVLIWPDSSTCRWATCASSSLSWGVASGERQAAMVTRLCGRCSGPHHRKTRKDVLRSTRDV